MPKRSDCSRGSVTVWLALTSVVMIICVGIAVDLGGQVTAQQRARDIAAQAARTAGEQVAVADAVRGETPRVDTAAAKAAARTFLDRAGVTGTVSIEHGNVLTVHVTDTFRPLFLSMVGIGTLRVSGSSTARLVRAVDGTER